MSSDHAQDWNNYWQGRSAKASGNALLGVGIENNDVLTTFWQNIFSNVPKSTQLVDFACGAGSVLMQAKTAGLSNLTGIDVSKNAIDVLQNKIPTAIGHVGAVDNTPFETDSFDMVVSQFGFEYAGGQSDIMAAVREMTRIIKPRGQIVLVSHIKDGAIARGCQQSLEQITRVTKSGFFESAKDCFNIIAKSQKATQQADKDAVMHAMTRLNDTAEPIMVWLRQAGDTKQEFVRFTYHLLESTHKLLVNLNNFHLKDCLTWLDDMRSEVLAYEGRMTSMLGAAISEELALRISEDISSNSAEVFRPEKLYFVEGDLPAAWVLRTN